MADGEMLTEAEGTGDGVLALVAEAEAADSVEAMSTMPESEASADHEADGASTSSSSGSEAGTPRPPNAPCIVFMDSLNMHNASEVAGNLNAYLLLEWEATKGRIAKRAGAGGALDIGASLSPDDFAAFDKFVKALLRRGLPLLRPQVSPPCI